MSLGKKNHYTILIVPHTEKETITLKIPVFIFQLIAILFVIGVFFMVMWVNQYKTLKRENENLKYVKVEAETMKKEFSDVVRDVILMKKSLASLEELEMKIREENNFDPTKSYFSQKKESVKISSLNDHGEGGTENQLLTEAKTGLAELKEALPERENGLKSLLEEVTDKNNLLASTPSIWPTVGRVTSRFGYRRDPFTYRTSFHSGIDIANNYNTPVYATADGKVIITETRGGSGKYIEIYHGRGISTTYSHLNKYLVKPGDKVKKGQLIALMGNTGRSTGPHLDYGVKEYGKYVNPEKYLP
ncbi:M23 family metallopeptidase [Microaerobacter geothermalis]|uniref:M23 family metallopeptidase n=1 Tax=Microaerobacter geothermalis TaxID=674972 RepID=UPI001F39A9D3|nr:M23 family metallopeptidase [Microaerobacter geothermalis]MCF6094668.1 M23 family metallopeptidase [Microaerobacter geothermalis]